MNDTLRDQILQYLDYWLDPAYAEGIIASTPNIYQALTELLLSGDEQLISITCFFVQNTVLTGKGPYARQFDEGLLTSPLIPTLKWLTLEAPQPRVRNRAATALGKMCIYDSVPVLIEAFQRYLETDPISLDGLLFEIRWLQQDSYSPDVLGCMQAAATSWSYLTRWAAVHLIDRVTHGQLTGLPDTRLLEALIHDEIPVIRAEAEFLQFKSEILSRIYSESVSKKERRAMWKQINQAEPALTFEKLVMQFQSPLRGRDSIDYHLMELMLFADTLINK